jgi:glycosyltransferase involved in cell wall biosynthesis
MLLPALKSALGGRVDAFESLKKYDPRDYDEFIYQLGNNPHHAPMYAEAMENPGVAVLHDLVLHHLIVEMTLARGDAEGYVDAMQANHGDAGAAWARGRAAGLHSEMGNFLLPASIEVAQRSRAVIVHNHYAADRLRSFGVTTPIHVVPHPYIPEKRAFPRHFPSDQRAIGFFGFLTSAKRAEIVLEAFRIAREKDPRLVLLIVGEPAPNIDVASLRGEGIVLTGYVSDDDFPSYYASADRLVNLRYPSAGETSGTLIRALDAGKPVAVSDYAQFAEFPDDVVFKVPLGAGEVERLVEFFTADLDDPSARQRAWLEENATLEKTVAGYIKALQPEARSTATPKSALPLFPHLELIEADASVRLVIRNAGDTIIRTRSYDQPEYRLIAKLFDGDAEVQDRWLALPRDLRPGDVAELAFPRIARKVTTLRLYHALQDVPMLEEQAWETARV